MIKTRARIVKAPAGFNQAQKFQQQDYNEALDEHRENMARQEAEDGG